MKVFIIRFKQKINQALESDIGFWRPSWILLKKLKNDKKNLQGIFPGSICILEIIINNPSRDVWLDCQILMMSKMRKAEISAKIMKRKKINVFIIRIKPKAFQHTSRVRSFP